MIALIAVGLTAPAVTASSPLDPGPLSFDARVECQRAIEEVHWRHRTWPTVNPGPKPAFDSVLSDSVLRERVTIYLQKSAALEVFWQRPLTGEQLQAEMNRMVRDTRDPSRLRELFDALDNDPLLIAECLARPALVDRLTRDWYALDPRFHGTVREHAEAALAAHRERGNRMPDLGGVYSVTEWRLAAKDSESADLEPQGPDGSVIDLEPEEWHERVKRFAAMFRRESEPEEAGAASALLDQIPLNRLSRLGETDDRFEVISVRSKAPDRVEVATVAWRKQSFDAWWREVGRAAVQSSRRYYDLLPPPGGYELQSPVDGGCDADTWTALFYVPSPRNGQTAVWTGTEMIVWGGNDGTYTDSGGRYDPGTDSWTATSTGAGVPPAGTISAGSFCCGEPDDCDDGVACTDDDCVAPSCVSTPNNANCPDDGQFCNGAESCDPVLNCVSSGDPCASGETCNEATDSCDTLACGARGDSCTTGADCCSGSCKNNGTCK